MKNHKNYVPAHGRSVGRPANMSWNPRRGRRSACIGTLTLASVMALALEFTLPLAEWRTSAQPLSCEINQSDQIAVRAARDGDLLVNLRENRDLLTSYAGAAEGRPILEQQQAEPLSLASADFDEDGVPDLVGGYSGPLSGILSLHRGNVDPE